MLVNLFIGFCMGNIIAGYICGEDWNSIFMRLYNQTVALIAVGVVQYLGAS